MVIEDLGNGCFRLTVEGGRVRDKRTLRTYREVICTERNVRYFEAV